MSAVQFSNAFAAELASSLTVGATALSLKSGHGAKFPAIAQGQDKYFMIAVVDKNGNREFIKIIQRTSGSDTLIVGSSMSDQPGGNVSGRAQEGTTALAITYTDDHVVEMRLTAGVMEWVANAIPAGEIILFDKDTAAIGYTLKTDVDDGLVYVTKGSAGGGDTGGGSKTGGTWTQPSHTHTGPSHTHTGPSHTHTFTSSVPSNILGAAGGGNNVGDSFHTHSGTTAASGTGATGAGGTGATGASATVNTWRPTGRNFTRQQRN